MKINIYTNTKSGGKFTDAFPSSSITGAPTDGPQSPGDEIIRAVDESRMRSDKILAQRFIEFLGNRRLTVWGLKNLFIEEQAKLRKEFLEG